MSKPKTLELSESAALLEVLRTQNCGPNYKQTRVRNYCLALFMLDAGLRVGEVVRLQQKHLVFEAFVVRTLTVPAEFSHAKTDRTIPLSDRLQQAIELLRSNYWLIHNGWADGYAFYRYHPRQRLTTRTVERIIRSAAIKAIGRPIHPHALRHTFATRLMKITSMRTVQVLLGHANIQSTQIYTHPSQDDKAAAINALNNSNSQETSLVF